MHVVNGDLHENQDVAKSTYELDLVSSTEHFLNVSQFDFDILDFSSNESSPDIDRLFDESYASIETATYSISLTTKNVLDELTTKESVEHIETAISNFSERLKDDKLVQDEIVVSSTATVHTSTIPVSFWSTTDTTLRSASTPEALVSSTTSRATVESTSPTVTTEPTIDKESKLREFEVQKTPSKPEKLQPLPILNENLVDSKTVVTEVRVNKSEGIPTHPVPTTSFPIQPASTEPPQNFAFQAPVLSKKKQEKPDKFINVILLFKFSRSHYTLCTF